MEEGPLSRFQQPILGRDQILQIRVDSRHFEPLWGSRNALPMHRSGLHK